MGIRLSLPWLTAALGGCLLDLPGPAAEDGGPCPACEGGPPVDDAFRVPLPGDAFVRTDGRVTGDAVPPDEDAAPDRDRDAAPRGDLGLPRVLDGDLPPLDAETPDAAPPDAALPTEPYPGWCSIYIDLDGGEGPAHLLLQSQFDGLERIATLSAYTLPGLVLYETVVYGYDGLERQPAFVERNIGADLWVDRRLTTQRDGEGRPVRQEYNWDGGDPEGVETWRWAPPPEVLRMEVDGSDVRGARADGRVDQYVIVTRDELARTDSRVHRHAGVGGGNQPIPGVHWLTVLVQYDEAWRIVGETATVPGEAAPRRVVEQTFDAVGNQTGRREVDTPPGGARTEAVWTFVYDCWD